MEAAMRDEDIPGVVQQLLVEMTAQRLITRALIGHLVTHSRRSISGLIESFEEALAKTEPDFFPLPGVDTELQAQASALARTRAEALLANLGAIVAPPRLRGTRRTARAA
jgi:hypothetical protein